MQAYALKNCIDNQPLGDAEVYVDSAQLELSDTPNRFNMIENGDLTDGTSQWLNTATGTLLTTLPTSTPYDVDSSHPTMLDANAFRFSGEAAVEKKIYQEIAIPGGQKGDTYSFGAWASSNGTLQTEKTVEKTTGLPESTSANSHTYANNFDYTWTYTVPDATSLTLEFGGSTTIGEGDKLFIMDGDGINIFGSPFTGKDLKGDSVKGIYVSKVVSGDTVKIRLLTDASGTAYGFKLNKITASIPETGMRRAAVTFLNGSTVVNHSYAYFGADCLDWQFTANSAIAKGNYDTIRYSLEFSNCRNEVYYDGAQLYRESFSEAYTYDSEGNLTGYASLLGQKSNFEYNKNNDIEKSIDAEGNETTYTYYSGTTPAPFALPTSKDNNIHLVESVTSAEGVKTTTEYNSKGQVTDTTLGTGNDKITGSTTYDNSTGLATAQTDARGNSVTTSYDANRQVTQVTGPSVNGVQSTVTNTYDTIQNMLRQIKLQQSGLGDVDYGYDSKGRLNAITRASTTYSHEFDEWGRVTAVKIGTTAMSTSEYYDGTETATVNGQTVTQPWGALKQTTFANGYYLVYLYDAQDRLIEVQDNNGTKESYVFDGEGNVYSKYDGKTNETTYYEYDHAGRCMASTTKDSTGNTVASYKYQYNELNQLSKLSCSVAGVTFSTTYTYDGDGRAKTTLVSSGKILTNTYDNLGRLTTKSWNFAMPYTTTLSYHPGANGNQSTLLATYQNDNDDAYEYEYDENGNITKITQGNIVIDYYYDPAGQLTREDNGQTNQTITYEYDPYGNLLYKRTYAYTTGDLNALIPDSPIPSDQTMVRVEAYDTSNAPRAGVTYEVYARVQSKLGTILTLIETLPATDANGIAESSAFYYDLKGTPEFFVQEVGDSAEHHFTPVGGAVVTVVIGTPASTPTPPPTPPPNVGAFPTEIMEYVYGNTDWNDQLTELNTYSVDGSGQTTLTDNEFFAYDDGGNPELYRGDTLTWAGRRLTSIDNGSIITSFTYDENGIRTSKTSNGVTTNYYYNGTILIGLTQESNTLCFSYDAGGSVISMNWNDTDYYYLRNGQRDVVALMDASGTKVVEYTYDTWGKPTVTAGSLAGTLGTLNPFRYRGYVYDECSGFYYCQSRYYDPSTAKFISPDALLSTGQGVLGYDMYAYCINNPVMYQDSSGYVIELVMKKHWTEEKKAAYINAYKAAIEYLKQNSKTAAELIERLQNADETITIEFNDSLLNSYDAKTIKWDPGAGLVLDDGSVNSAALGLAHEMGHAAQGLSGTLFRLRFAVGDYRTLVENDNLDIVNKIAGELGEFPRESYRDGSHHHRMSNSTEWGVMVNNPDRSWWHFWKAKRVFESRNS